MRLNRIPLIILKANSFAKQFASINDIRIEEDENEVHFYKEVEDNWFEQNENTAIENFSNEIKAGDP